MVGWVGDVCAVGGKGVLGHLLAGLGGVDPLLLSLTHSPSSLLTPLHFPLPLQQPLQILQPILILQELQKRRRMRPLLRGRLHHLIRRWVTY